MMGLRAASIFSALVALSACSSKPAKMEGTAPYSWKNLPGSGPRTTDPVTIELYIYKKNGMLTRDPSDYAYVGTPWRIRMPGNYFQLLTDPDGGAQGHVFIQIDGRTWEPSRKSVPGSNGKRLYGSIGNLNPEPLSVRDEHEIVFDTAPTTQDFVLGIEPSVRKSKEIHTRYLFKSIENQKDKYIIAPYGKACGVDWLRQDTVYGKVYIRRDDPRIIKYYADQGLPVPSASIRFPEAALKEFQKAGFPLPENLPKDPLKVSEYRIDGYVLDSKFGGIGLSCDSTSTKCFAQFDLPYTKGFPMNVSFPQRHICKYRDIIGQFDAMMRKYTITYPDVNKAYDND